MNTKSTYFKFAQSSELGPILSHLPVKQMWAAVEVPVAAGMVVDPVAVIQNVPLVDPAAASLLDVVFVVQVVVSVTAKYGPVQGQH